MLTSELVFAGFATLVVLLQWLQHRRAQAMLDQLTLRSFFLKGLNPAVVDPERFGPRAMAEAHRIATAAPEPRDEEDVDQALIDEQVSRWTREAEAHRQAQEAAIAQMRAKADES